MLMDSLEISLPAFLSYSLLLIAASELVDAFLKLLKALNVAKESIPVKKAKTEVHQAAQKTLLTKTLNTPFSFN